MANLAVKGGIKRDQVLGVVIFLVQGFNSVYENLMLMLAKNVYEWLCSIPKDLTLESNVVFHIWQAFFVEIYQVVERPLCNVQSRERW